MPSYSKCLIAILRTLVYKDYVDEQPEICESMCKHGESLIKYIDRLKNRNLVNKEISPLIMVCYSLAIKGILCEKPVSVLVSAEMSVPSLGATTNIKSRVFFMLFGIGCAW